MKKMLSLLSIITISATAIPTTIAASPYQKQENKLESNEINNLEILNRNKRENNNKIENWYCFLCHNHLVAKISHNTWQRIADNYVKTTTLEQDRNYVRTLLNNFEKRNSSADTNAASFISDDDIKILTNVIVDHFNEVNDAFKRKNNNNIGLIIKTNRNSYWAKHDDPNNDFYWGVSLNYNEQFDDKLNGKNGENTKLIFIGLGTVAIVAAGGGTAFAAMVPIAGKTAATTFAVFETGAAASSVVFTVLHDN